MLLRVRADYMSIPQCGKRIRGTRCARWPVGWVSDPYGLSVVRSIADADGRNRALSASAGFFKRQNHPPHRKNPSLALRALMNAPEKLNTYSDPSL